MNYREGPFFSALQATFWLEWRRFLGSPVFWVLAVTRPFIWLLLLSEGLVFAFGGGHVPLPITLTAYIAAFTGITSAFALTYERDRGLLLIWNSMRVNRYGYIIGKCIFSVILCCGIFVLALGLCMFAFGGEICQDKEKVDALNFYLGSLLMFLVLSVIGICIASFLTRLDWFGPIMNFILFPMLFTSGAFYRVEDTRWWLKIISMLNPMHHIVAFIDPQSGSNASIFGILGLIWTAIICGTCFMIAVWQLRKET